MRIENEDTSAIDYTFYWHGNPDLILTIIKLIEDRMNADNDILQVGVQSILLVEDSVKYYSTYLPTIYKLVLQQSREFAKEALNEQQQKLRKRAGRRSCWRRTTRRRSNCMKNTRTTCWG